MSTAHSPQPGEVEELLRNAQLRDELEPYFDEAIVRLNVRELPTPQENEFLASMLDWERAPSLPIGQWFEPELKLPPPDELSDVQLQSVLRDAIHRLFERRIVLDFTDHLSDRALYCLICRDILPAPEKKLAVPQAYLHWDCSDAGGDPDMWLRYYATAEDRESWLDEYGGPLPPHESPPFPREMPREPS